LSDPPRYQSRVRKRAEPNGDVEAFRNQIKIAVGKRKFNPNAGVGVEKTRDERSDMPAPE
jgi:hypothetical protein